MIASTARTDLIGVHLDLLAFANQNAIQYTLCNKVSASQKPTRTKKLTHDNRLFHAMTVFVQYIASYTQQLTPDLDWGNRSECKITDVWWSRQEMLQYTCYAGGIG